MSNEDIQDPEAVFYDLARRAKETGVSSTVANVAEPVLRLLVQRKPAQHDGDPLEHLGKVDRLHPLPTKVGFRANLDYGGRVLNNSGAITRSGFVRQSAAFPSSSTAIGPATAAR